MVYAIACVLGLVVAGLLTLMILSLIPSLEGHIGMLIFVFLLLWGASIWVFKIAWWLFLIIAPIALVVYIVNKKKSLKIDDDDVIESFAKEASDDSTVSEDNNEL